MENVGSTFQDTRTGSKVVYRHLARANTDSRLQCSLRKVEPDNRAKPRKETLIRMDISVH